MVDSRGSNSHFLLTATTYGEGTIRQDLRGRVLLGLHLSHPLALPCPSDCATDLETLHILSLRAANLPQAR